MDRAPIKAVSGFDCWQASLDLAYAYTGDCTIPVRRAHSGPLRVQKHLYDEGQEVCQHIIVHPPGGIAGGDELRIDVEVGNGAHALITSPGAAKWYRGFGRMARQNLNVRVTGGVLEWLPQETMLFNGAEVAIENRFELDADARLIALDVVSLGRHASGEKFGEGLWRQKNEIRRTGRLIWHEQIVLPGGSDLLDAAVGMGGDPVLGSLLWAGPALPAEITAACRELDLSGRFAVTQLPEIWVARYLGAGVEETQTALRKIWALIRPAALGREAVAPRIWAT